MNKNHIHFMKEAINEAKIGLTEGGIPNGSVIVHRNKIIGIGRTATTPKTGAT